MNAAFTEPIAVGFSINKKDPTEVESFLKWCGAVHRGGEPPTQGFSVLFRHRRIPHRYILLRYLAKIIFLYSLPTPDLNHFRESSLLF